MIVDEPEDGARVLLADIGDDIEVGRPELELALPVDDRRERHRHEERARAVALLVQRVQERDRLYRLAQAHLVSQDRVDACEHTIPTTINLSSSK